MCFGFLMAHKDVQGFETMLKGCQKVFFYCLWGPIRPPLQRNARLLKSLPQNTWFLTQQISHNRFLKQVKKNIKKQSLHPCLGQKLSRLTPMLEMTCPTLAIPNA